MVYFNMIFCTVDLKLLRWIFDRKQHNAFESECVKEAKRFWLNGWIGGAKNIGAHMSISWRWYQRGYMDHWLSIRPVRIRQLCAHGLNAISASGAKGQSGAFCVHGNGSILRKIKQTRANYFLSRRAWAMLMLRPSHGCSCGGVE